MIDNIDIANKLYDTALRVKFYHWTLGGVGAPYLHAQLDELYDDLIGYSDRLFEDALVHSRERVYFYFELQEPSNSFSVTHVIQDLVAGFEELVYAIEALSDMPRSTDNILDDVAEGLVNWNYLLRLNGSS